MNWLHKVAYLFTTVKERI